jgi:hypothetical protein
MCTLIAIHRHFEGIPLVVAANRDERFDRPSEGPAVRSGAAGPLLAPLDLEAGGTWLGLGASGLFAAVTNRRGASPDPSLRSRGLVVLDALAAASARDAAEWLAGLPARAYNPFHAFVADAEEAFLLVYQEAPRLRPCAPGVHVVGNADPDTDEPKLRRIRERAERAAGLAPAEALEELGRVCREHGAGGTPLDDACVHLPGYGTRSSLLLALGESRADSRLLYADGPPCENEYRDLTPLLGELSESARYAPGETSARMAS